MGELRPFCALYLGRYRRSRIGYQAPLIQNANPVPGHYVVQFRDARSGLDAEVRGLGGRETGRYNLIPAITAELPAAALEALRKNPNVAFVEQDAVIELSADKSAPNNTTPGNIVSDLWGLDVIDRNPQCRTNQKYGYSNTGSSTSIYIIDASVDGNHAEFTTGTGSSRVRRPQDLIQQLETFIINTYGYDTPYNLDPNCGTYSSLAANHGNAVASLAAGKTYGTAIEARIVSAQAFSCWGASTLAIVNKALEWIPTDSGYTGGPRVVNLSFEFWSYQSGSSSMTQLINALSTQHNITVVAAAGNHGGNVNWTVPASSAGAITVGAIAKTPSAGGEQIWSHSGYGGKVDLYAPGQYVQSAHGTPPLYRSGDVGTSLYIQCYNTDPEDGYQDSCTSGTSFSAPLVAGLAAVYLHANPSASPTQVQAYLESSSAYTVTDPDGFTRKVVNVNSGGTCN